jgi:hypothetical protein
MSFWERDFSTLQISSLTLWPRQTPIQWALGMLPKGQMVRTYSWPLTHIQKVEFVNEWSCTSPPCICPQGMHKDNFIFTFTILIGILCRTVSVNGPYNYIYLFLFIVVSFTSVCMGNPRFALALCHGLQPLAQTEERSVECKFYPVLFKKSACCKRECITDAYSFASICKCTD